MYVGVCGRRHACIFVGGQGTLGARKQYATKSRFQFCSALSVLAGATKPSCSPRRTVAVS